MKQWKSLIISQLFCMINPFVFRNPFLFYGNGVEKPQQGEKLESSLHTVTVFIIKR
jgi:hypothetical protein